MDNDGNDICDICGYIADHTHSFEDKWSWDETTHYHKSACGHNVKQDEAKHKDENNDGICDVCTYDYDHTHTYAEEWVAADAEGHWHAPTCGHTVDGADKTPHADENNDGDCDVCGYNGGHVHTYADEWTQTEDEHWHEVTCGHNVPVGDKGVHKDEDGDTICDVCGHAPEHFHTFEEGWSADANTHYHASTCGHDVRKEEAAHSGYEEDGVCDVCGYVVFHLYQVTVTAPEYVKVYAPDGTETTTFTVKENTPVTFRLAIPTYAELVSLTGARQEGKPTLDGDCNVYTVCLDGITADATVTVVGNKLSAVEVLVADGQGTMSIEKSFAYFFADITFEAPKAGRYMIFSTSHETVQFGIGELDEEGYAIFPKVYFMDVAEPGTVSLQARYFSMSVPANGKLDFTYTVSLVDSDITLRSLVADGYTLPTNSDVTIHFIAPKAGRYQVSSSTLGMIWNDYMCDSIVLTATEDNQPMSFTLRYENASTPSFDFDCTIVSMEGTPLTEGDNTVTAPYGSYQAVTVTATQAGTYLVQAHSPYFRFFTWSEDTAGMVGQGSSYTRVNMKKGEKFTLYVSVNIYEYEGTEDITDTVTVSFLGYVPAMSGTGYEAKVDTLNSYVSDYADSIFILSVPAGDSISIDGGQTWAESVQVSLSAYGFVTYQVQSGSGADTVSVHVQRVVNEFTLQVGTQTQTLIPGVEYTVHLSGSQDPAYFVNYVLSWTNESLTASYNGKPLQAGGTVANYGHTGAVVLVLSGNDTVEVEFTLTDPYAGGTDTPAGSVTLAQGDNAVQVTVDNGFCAGTTATFTAQADGTYVLSAAAGETNAEVVRSVSGVTETLTLPYTFTASKGETITFTVCTTAVTTLTADTIDLRLERVPTGEDETAALNGTYHVNFIVTGMYVLTFENGTLTVTDNNNGEAAGTYRCFYTAADGVVVTQTDGSACGIEITRDSNGSMTFKCPGLGNAQNLIPA